MAALLAVLVAALHLAVAAANRRHAVASTVEGPERRQARVASHVRRDQHTVGEGQERRQFVAEASLLSSGRGAWRTATPGKPWDEPWDKLWDEPDKAEYKSAEPEVFVGLVTLCAIPMWWEICTSSSILYPPGSVLFILLMFLSVYFGYGHVSHGDAEPWLVHAWHLICVLIIICGFMEHCWGKIFSWGWNVWKKMEWLGNWLGQVVSVLVILAVGNLAFHPKIVVLITFITMCGLQVCLLSHRPCSCDSKIITFVTSDLFLVAGIFITQRGYHTLWTGIVLCALAIVILMSGCTAACASVVVALQGEEDCKGTEREAAEEACVAAEAPSTLTSAPPAN